MMREWAGEAGGGHELERDTDFWTSQQYRECNKSWYDKLEPAKKKARLQ